jgi:outer membrane protein OmpA-like peptidoglycan-associated protein
MLGVATAIASLLVMKSAAAQDKGFALQQFEPAPAGDRFFGVPDAHVTGTQPYVMLLGNYGYKPLSLRQQNASGGYDNIATLDKNQFYLHIDATMTVADRLLINVDVPIALAQSGDSTTSGGQAINNNVGSGLADIRAGGRINIVGSAKDPFSFAVGGDVWLPTGKQEKLTGDENLRGAPKLYVSGNTGSFVYSANLGYMFRHFQDLGTPKIGNAVVFGAAAGVLVADGMVQIGPEIYGNTVTNGNKDSDPNFKETAFGVHRTPLEAILGARLRLGDVVIGAGAGPGLTKAPGTPAFRALGSVAFVPEVKVAPGDRDHDGITDDKDACPDTAGVPNADPKLNGCPPPPPPDRDHDGIADPQDACPDAPGVKDADPKKNGCPPDKDGDGIPDAQDACPDVAGVKSDDPKKNGCPPDKDGDGIPDATDACPDVAGVADPDPKKNGCPKLASLVGKEIKIAEQVHFETGKAVIKADSDKLLGEVAAIMKEHTEISSMSIEGHTDSKGAKGANKQLSQQRADAVKKWLSTKGGVDAKRMTAKGFGQDKPIQTNDTEDGRAANRRVEFHVETKDGAAAPPATPPKADAPKAPPAKPAAPPAKPKKLGRSQQQRHRAPPFGVGARCLFVGHTSAMTRSAAAAVVDR